MNPTCVLRPSFLPSRPRPSFGVIVWEMYTGQRPYGGLTHGQILHAVTTGKPLPVGASCPQVRARLGAGPCMCAPSISPTFPFSHLPFPFTYAPQPIIRLLAPESLQLLVPPLSGTCPIRSMPSVSAPLEFFSYLTSCHIRKHCVSLLPASAAPPQVLLVLSGASTYRPPHLPRHHRNAGGARAGAVLRGWRMLIERHMPRACLHRPGRLKVRRASIGT